jgi:hypothetical protein
MDFKQSFSQMIEEGKFDKPIYKGVGRRRIKRRGIELLRDATDGLVANGKMTGEEQQQLLKELAQRMAGRLAR